MMKRQNTQYIYKGKHQLFRQEELVAHCYRPLVMVTQLQPSVLHQDEVI